MVADHYGYSYFATSVEMKFPASLPATKVCALEEG